jgi:hypothetical protein
VSISRIGRVSWVLFISAACFGATLLVHAGPVVVSIGQLAASQEPTDTIVETGGFVSVVDATVGDGNHVVAVSFNALVEYKGATWTTTILADDRRRLTAVDEADGRVWVTAEDCAVGWPEDGSLLLNQYEHGCRLYDIAALSDTSAIAVGESRDGHGLIVVIEGGGHRLVEVPEVRRLLAVALDDLGTGWAGGADAVVSFDARTLEVDVDTEAVPGCAVNSIDINGEDDVWVAGRCLGPSGDRLDAEPMIAHYDGRDWRRLPVDRQDVHTVSEIDVVGPSAGWAVCDGYVILGYDGSRWTTAADFYGSVISQGFSAMAAISPSHAFFMGSNAFIVEFRDGEYQRYLDGRSRKSLLLDYGELQKLDILDGGEGWAVGAYGPPLHRDSASGVWRPRDDVPIGSELISVSAASHDDVWFGSHPRRGAAKSRLVHFDGVEFSVFDAPTALPIWHIAADGEGGGWAVASNWIQHSEPALTEILILSDGEWTLGHRLEGERLVNGDIQDRARFVAVGTAAFECTISSCARIAGFEPGFVTDVAFTSEREGYALGALGKLYHYDGDGWSLDASFSAPEDDLWYSVDGGANCLIVTGRNGARIRVGGVWQDHKLRVVMDGIHLAFRDVRARDQNTVTQYWSAGAYNTVVTGVCEAGMTPPTPTGTAPPTATGTHRETATPTPSTRHLVLPWCGT